MRRVIPRPIDYFRYASRRCIPFKRTRAWLRRVENQQDIEIHVPPLAAVGSYANLVGVWHSPHDFALDFCLVQPFTPDGPQATVVSRVRIPPTVVLNLLQSLSQNLLEYEKTYGEVQRPPADDEEGGDEQ